MNHESAIQKKNGEVKRKEPTGIRLRIRILLKNQTGLKYKDNPPRADDRNLEPP